MADLKKTIEILFEGNDQASRKAADVLGKIKELETQAGTASPKIDGVAGSLEKIGKPSTLTGISAATAALAAFASKQLYDAFIDANTQVEKFEKGIGAIKGGQTATELAYIRDAANKMGLDVGTAANAYLKLVAAAQGSPSEGSTKGLFEAVSKAIVATGGSSNEASGAFKALEQMMSKGKVTAEELKGQLSEHLPGAFNLSAKAMGVTKEELVKMLEKGVDVNDFIPRFIKTLNDNYGDKVSFDGYAANLNRLRNAIDDLLVQAGKAGLFDAITSGIKATTGVVGELGISFGFWGGAWDVVKRFVASGDINTLTTDFGNLKDKTQQLAADLQGKQGLNETLAETNRLLRGEAAATQNEFEGNQSAAETNRLKRYEEDAKKAAKEAADLDKVLKGLGVDPKKTDEGISAIANLLKELANNPQANGTDFQLGVEAALKKVATSEQLGTIKRTVTDLFNEGKIDAHTYAEALKDIDKAAGKMDGSDSGLRKAQKAAQDFKLEMEKLASNERIKLIEAKVQLDVANVEAQTKRVQAAFESISNTISSTGETISSLWGNMKDLSGLDKFHLEDQIEEENRRRDEALALQKELTQAQIAVMRAQSQAMEKGDSLIKIDGAGLQPHLEAFMWEILRTIQVRVNQDGLKLLLGA